MKKRMIIWEIPNILLTTEFIKEFKGKKKRKK